MQPSPHSPPDPVPTLALTGTQTRFSQEPADQTVVAGQRAVLPCVLLNYSGIVQWTKDGLALGMGQGLKGEWGSPAPSLPHLGLPPLTNKEYWTHAPCVLHSGPAILSMTVLTGPSAALGAGGPKLTLTKGLTPEMDERGRKLPRCHAYHVPAGPQPAWV